MYIFEFQMDMFFNEIISLFIQDIYDCQFQPQLNWGWLKLDLLPVSLQIPIDKSLVHSKQKLQRNKVKLGCWLKYLGLATDTCKKAESVRGTHAQPDSADGEGQSLCRNKDYSPI